MCDIRLYRGIIEPKSSFSSELQSDTFFGAFCWSYRYCYGEDALTELLVSFEEHPRIIFSNAFPGGMLPIPLGIYDKTADYSKLEKKEEKQKSYQAHKKVKNAGLISIERFRKIQQGDYAGFSKELQKGGLQEQMTMHNMPARSTGNVQRIEESGNLYEDREWFAAAASRYDLYILSDLEEEVLQRTIRTMCLLGIGKNKSTGKGAFELVGWEAADELLGDGTETQFVALSNFIPAQDDPTDGRYKTIAKYGKLDREYAMSEAPFKKPMLFIKAGARFRTEQCRPYYGRLMKNIALRPEVVVNAYTIALPLKEETE